MPYVYQGVEISWLGHASFYLKYGDMRVYFDPYKIKPRDKATHVFISHEHFDHLSIDDLKKIVKTDTNIIAPEPCRRQLSTLTTGVVKYVKAGEEYDVAGLRFKVVPAYNINKFREPGVVYHPREARGVGYVVEVGGVKFYHTGDTDHIPEMRDLLVDVVFIPVSGTFVMTPEEAAEAVNEINPKIAIPMHYGAIVGGMKEVEEFKKRVKTQIIVLEKE